MGDVFLIVSMEGKVYMNIAICDDNKYFIEEFKSILKKDKRISTIYEYNKSNELLDSVKNNEFIIDAVFMDIELGGSENGIEVGSELYKLNPNIPIIYITGYHDRFDQEMFLNESNLVGYMTKPVNENILDKYIEKISKNINMRNILKFSIRGKEHMILMSDITYLESSNHKTILHTLTKEYSVYEKLGDIKKRLSDSFVSCHKSFLINMDKVEYVNGNTAYIAGGALVPISRSHKEEVKNKYFDYIGEKL